MTPTPRIFALVVAAGVGRRAGGVVPKQYAPIAGKPLLRYSIEALSARPAIRGVQVVIHPEHADFYAAAMGQGEPLPPGEATRLGALAPSRSGEGGHPHAALGPHPDMQPTASGGRAHPASPEGRGAQTPAPSPILEAESSIPRLLPPVIGGAERTDSVRAGLAALAQYQPDFVLIHDAARPFLTQAMIGNLIIELTADEAVLPALPVNDTVRRFEGGKWKDVNRAALMRMQTPQVFPYARIRELVDATKKPVTDEAALWLAAGGALRYVDGDEDLRKVTTSEDIVWAEHHASLTRNVRRTAVGMGFDVHALMPSGEKGTIRLAGLDIVHHHTLHGHSDADVVLHAIVDALLGSIAAGDIGSHFPPADARWKGADSAIFVAEAGAQVKARGGIIQHLDVTIIGEHPKVSPHREAMRARIAELLELPLSAVSVKATTTEKLGFTGREEGIAAQAVATVTLPAEAA